jgi:hypothetical protein
VQLHHLRNLLHRGDTQGFANELNLNPQETRQWFERGFPHEGYDGEVIRALGTLVLTRMVTTTRDRKDDTHG